MKLFVVSFILCVLLVSCEKDLPRSGAAVAIQITNAIAGGPNVGFNSLLADSVVNSTAKVFSVEPGNSSLVVYSRINTSRTIYSQSQVMDKGEIYSMFLAGSDATPETILLKDNIPVNTIDSSFGVRIVNLSPNSSPLNITLASAPAENLFQNVQYKQLTNFTRLSLKLPVNTSAVTFQIRNNSNTLLATYTLPAAVNNTYPNISTTLTRNKAITLVVKGLVGTTSGTSAFGAFPVANY